MVCLSDLSAISKERCEQVEELCCNLKTVLRLDQFKNWEERWKMNTRPKIYVGHIPKPQVDIVCPPYEVVTCNCIVRNSTGDVVLRQPGDQVASAGWWLCCYLCGGTTIQLGDIARDFFKQPLSFGLLHNWLKLKIKTDIGRSLFLLGIRASHWRESCHQGGVLQVYKEEEEEEEEHDDEKDKDKDKLVMRGKLT